MRIDRIRVIDGGAGATLVEVGADGATGIGSDVAQGGCRRLADHAGLVHAHGQLNVHGRLTAGRYSNPHAMKKGRCLRPVVL
jgi:hypothetical protein